MKIAQIIIVLTICLFVGCTQVQQEQPTQPSEPSIERGIGISIGGPQQPQDTRAIEMLSARITDLEQRVTKLEHPSVPLPNYPLPRD